MPDLNNFIQIKKTLERSKSIFEKIKNAEIKYINPMDIKDQFNPSREIYEIDHALMAFDTINESFFEEAGPLTKEQIEQINTDVILPDKYRKWIEADSDLDRLPADTMPECIAGKQPKTEWEETGLSEAEFYRIQYFELRRSMSDLLDRMLEIMKEKGIQ